MQLQNDEREEMVRENETNFTDAYQGPAGPMKFMSDEAKEKVHLELDQRLQEIEDTGLSR